MMCEDMCATVCEHCGIMSPDHPDAAKNGGISVYDGACVVCIDYYEEAGFWPDTTQQQLSEADE